MVEQKKHNMRGIIIMAITILVVVGLFFAYVIGKPIKEDEQIGKIITESYLVKLKENGIGHIKSGVDFSSHYTGHVTGFKEHSVLPYFSFHSWKYQLNSNTPESNIIVHDQRVEVRYNQDKDSTLEKEVRKISDVIDFALSNHALAK